MSGEHWYRKTGESCHLIKGANGKERATNLTDARKLGLLPSVTTCMSIYSKPELETWKFRQITERAFCYPPQAKETPEEYHKRIVDGAFEQVEDAADLGTRIHAAIEAHLGGQPYDEELRVYVDAMDAWLKKEGVEVTGTEQRLVSLSHGYAGTTDLTFRHNGGVGIGDWKTRKTKPKYPATPWADQPCQISAYFIAKYGRRPEPQDSGFNLFISTTEPGRVEGVWYDAAKLNAEWEVFEHTLAVWRNRRNYDPRIV